MHSVHTIAGVYAADAERDFTSAEITATPGALANLKAALAELVAATR